MMGTRVWRMRIATPLALVMIWGRLMWAAAATDTKRVSMCPRESVLDSILGFRDRSCVVYGGAESLNFAGATEVRVRQFSFFSFFFLTTNKNLVS